MKLLSNRKLNKPHMAHSIYVYVTAAGTGKYL